MQLRNSHLATPDSEPVQKLTPDSLLRMQFNDAVLLPRDTLCNLQLLSINRGLIGGTKVGQEGFNVIGVADVEAASLEILGDLAPCPTLTYDCCHSLFFPANREIRGRGRRRRRCELGVRRPLSV